MQGKQEKWVCGSVMQRVNPVIPAEWAKCLGDINQDRGQDDFTFDEMNEYRLCDIPFYQSMHSNFKICLMCAEMWQKFFDTLSPA